MKSIILSIILLLSILQASAQTVAGRVTDTEGNPLAGASVVVAGTTTGTASDADGRFGIDCSLPARLHISCVGFEPTDLEVTAASPTVSVRLSESNRRITDVDVRADRKSAGFERLDASLTNIAVDASGGIESIVKSQMGVSSSNELSSQYRVRGGSFDENMVYVNGIEIYRPFLIRSGEQEGLSFVNPDMVGSVNFSAGGFDASYDDKMSSVLDVSYRQPQQTGASASVSLLGASASVAGSMAGGRVTHISGIRYKTNQYLFGTLDTSGDYAPSFVDVQSYWTATPCERLGIDVLGYFARNRYLFEPTDRETSFGTVNDVRTLKIYFDGKEDDRYLTGMTAAGIRFDINPDNRLNAGASYYRSLENENYDIIGEYWLQQLDAASTTENVDQTTGIGIGGYLQHARNELLGEIYCAYAGGRHSTSRHSLTWQVRSRWEHFDCYTDQWELRDSAGYIMDTQNTLELGDIVKADNSLSSVRLTAFAMDDIEWRTGDATIRLNCGLRLAHMSYNGETLVSPRASLRIVQGNKAFRIASGLYYQAPLYREIQRPDGSLNPDIKSQRSLQLIAGTDIYFSISDRPFKFTTEAYYKHLSRINTYQVDNMRITYSAENNAHGYAAGIDFKLNGQLVPDVESWVCLSLMKTVEDVDDDGHGNIPRPTDQRVMFSMFFQDYLPTNKSIGANLSLYLGSGLPFGPPDSERYKATNRMPGYKRVDAGFFKDFARQTDGTLRNRRLRSFIVGVEVFNLFDLDNTVSYFWVSDIDNRQYAVPNYLTSRRINLKLSITF